MPRKGECRPLVERFWEKVNRNGPIPLQCPELGPCWLWTSAHNGRQKESNRYGIVWIGNGQSDYAHRVSYVLAHGPIPEGLLVCHRCDVGLCVNDGHFFLGTPSDNMRDMSQKGRCKKQTGEFNHAAKLTEEQVRWVIKEHNKGKGHGDISGALNISSENISRIVQKHTWKHLNLQIQERTHSDYMRAIAIKKNAGIYPLKNGRWLVQIFADKKVRHIGHFDTYEQATIARREAEIRYWQVEISA